MQLRKDIVTNPEWTPPPYALALSGPVRLTPEDMARTLPSARRELSDDEMALELGHSYLPSFNPNEGGSAENTWNTILNRLTTEQLMKRYAAGRGSTGTTFDRNQQQAYTTAKSLLGRDISESEFLQILPAFQGPNGLVNGRAFVANLAQMYKANPALDPFSQMNMRSSGDISGSVQQQFQSILGRAATQDELEHFSQAIKSNEIDAFGLGSFLKTQPEYTNARDREFRSGLNDELAGYDQTAFNRMKGDVISSYGANGITPGSSPSLDYAITEMMGKLAENRSKFLSGLSAEQYGGNKDIAVGNYKNTVDRMYDENASRRRGEADYGRYLLDRGYEGADYQTQRDDYMRYLDSQPKYKPNAFDYLNTGANVVRAYGSLR